ncbi:MAG: ABC transporter permease [Gemmatimonadetes bacterium]|nr:ABC transporter permease [Gemmatimonadota bacterium]
MKDWKKWLTENLDLPSMANGRDRRIMEELADHLEEMEAEALARGRSSADAEAETLAWLGDPAEASKELLKCEPGHVRAQMSRWAEEREELLRQKGGRWVPFADLARDLRMALRSLAKWPFFSVVAVLVLALGIGATSAIFTLVDAVILSPLPFEDAGQLIAVQHAAPGRGMADVGQCAAWHYTYIDEAQSFEDLGMFTGSSASVTGRGNPEALQVLQVTSGVFPAIRVNPLAGRIFTEEDMDPDGPARIMLAQGYWESRFGADPSAVGQTLQVDGVTREIIGVMPEAIQGLGYQPSIILPLRFRRSDLFVGNIGYNAVARLRPRVTMEEAHADLTRVFPQAWEKFPGGPVASSDSPDFYEVDLRSLKEDLVGSVANLLWILLGGVSVVLLIACANVANLFLVRADGKDGEMAVRTAMGASRRRITWEYLKESILLGLMGGIGGLVLAQLGLRTLLAFDSASLPRMNEVTLDLSVLLFSLALSVGAGLFFGLFPMLRKGKEGFVGALKEGGRSGMRDRGRNRVQNLLAISQMALALVLLVASGLMLRTYQSLSNRDPGFGNPEEVLALRLFIPGGEAPRGEDVATTYEMIVRRLEEVPGVSSVGLATAIPMAGGGNVNPFMVRGQELDSEGATVIRRHKWIGPNYLETMQIPLLMGRTVTWAEIHARAPVALLSETLANQVFGSPEEALGQFVAARPDPPQWKEVIGIVSDVREDGLSQPFPDLVYWPHVTLGFWEGNAPDQVQVWRGAGIAIRSERVGTPGFLNDVQEAIWEISPNLPLMGVGPLDGIMAQSVARTSFAMVLLGISGMVALILGLVGVYGVISYAVSQRSGELGMRMALGAQTGQVKTMVLKQGLALAGVGIGLGLVLAVGLTRYLSSLLFGVSAVDPLTYGAVAVGLLVVALLASYLPARRASKVDPMTALRVE